MWWAFGCCSPVIYLLIAHGLRVTGIAAKAHTWAGLDAGPAVLLPFAAAMVAAQTAMLVLRMHFDRRMNGAEPGQVFDFYRRRTLFFLVLSDTTAFLGLVLFILTGKMWAVLALGCAGLLLYGQSYPSERGLVARIRRAGGGNGQGGGGQ